MTEGRDEMPTPETDAAEKWLREERSSGGALEIVAADFARQLERSLAQAQARIGELERERAAVVETLGHDEDEFHEARTLAQTAQTFVDAHKRDTKKLVEQAATIRELEKIAVRYKFLTEQCNDWHVERWISGPRGSGTWKSIRGTALDKAIDSALAKEKADD